MARKKEKNNGVNAKHTQAYERLSFLHQASMLMSNIEYDIPTLEYKKKENNVKNWEGDPKGRILGTARYLNNNMKQITSKLVLRVDPSIKRSICKRCETPVVPVITSKIRIQSQTIVYTCKICKAKRRFKANNPNYELFNERQDIVVVDETTLSQ